MDDIVDGVTRLFKRSNKPTVGRIVHYVAYGTPGGEFPAGVCRAAVVTEVDQVGVEASVQMAGNGSVWSIGICVLNPTGLYFNRHILYDEKKSPGSWHWPERSGD